MTFPQTVLDVLKTHPTARGDLVEWLGTLKAEYQLEEHNGVLNANLTEAMRGSAKSAVIDDMLARLLSVEREEVARHEYHRQTRS